MFQKIGIGDSGEPLVLSEFNRDEKEALQIILIEAERGWATNPTRYGTRRGRILRSMISELRRTYEIPEEE
jgi:hypothetical protein